MILAKPETEQEKSSASDGNYVITNTDYILATVLLILNPIFNSSGSIALRQLKELHDYTSSAYMGIAMSVVYGSIIYMWGMGFDFIWQFNRETWYVFILLGMIAVV